MPGRRLSDADKEFVVKSVPKWTSKDEANLNKYETDTVEDLKSAILDRGGVYKSSDRKADLMVILLLLLRKKSSQASGQNAQKDKQQKQPQALAKSLMRLQLQPATAKPSASRATTARK